MTAKHTPKLTGEQIKAHLTQEELERIDRDRPQMTYATTQFIESLVEERIQKAALLAACKKFLDNAQLHSEHATEISWFAEDVQEFQSAMSQAGESEE